MNVELCLSIIEVYNDEVRDLLNNKVKLQVRDSGDDVILVDLKTEKISTMKDMYTHYLVAQSRRSTMATSMNDVSSRSHCLFIVELIQTGPNGVVKSRLVLCDLAGSEKVKKSGVEGQALKEAQAINLSLTCLGTVVNAMYKEQKHIPFRDSKLTKLLRPSLVDPTSYVLLIANLSPIARSHAESVSSLRFANQVKGMKASDVSAVDSAAEEQYLLSLRALEEYCCELRVACAECEYQMSRHRPTLQQQFKGEVKVTAVANLLKQEAQENEIKSRQESEDSVRSMIEELSQRGVNEWRQRVSDSHGNLQKLTAENTALKSSTVDAEATCQDELKAISISSEEACETRKGLEAHVGKLNTELITVRATMERAKQSLDQVLGLEDGDVRNAQTEVDSLSKACSKSEAAFTVGTRFASILTALYANMKSSVEQEMKFAKVQLKYWQSELETNIPEWQEMIHQLILGALNIDLRPKPACSKVFRNATNAQRFQELDNYDVPLQNGVSKHGETSIDRVYRMAFVDTPSLTARVYEYLKQGGLLAKHGRSGPPKFRYFWMGEENKVKTLCWCDPAKKVRSVKKQRIETLDRVLLGASPQAMAKWKDELTREKFYLSFTCEFRRGRTLHLVAMCMEEFEAWVYGLCHSTKIQPSWAPKPASFGSGNATFASPTSAPYTAISYSLGSPLSMTTPLTVSNLGLSHDEVTLMERNHIPTDLFQRITSELANYSRNHPPEFAAKFVQKRLQRSEKGAFYLSRGQLRAVYGLDIFRTAVLWDILESKGFVSRPPPKTPTSKDSVVSTQSVYP